MARGSSPRIGIAAVALLVMGCSMGTDEAKQGVAEFRARAANQSFNEIYQASGPEFRQAATEEQFARFMTALERKLGAWQSAADPGWHVNRGSGGHSVRLTYDSRFTKGAAGEQFAWRLDGGRPVLVGYQVNSPLLLTE